MSLLSTRSRRPLRAAVFAVAGSMLASGSAFAAESSEVSAELKQLRDRISQLEAKQASEAQQAKVDTAVDAAATDAATRSPFLATSGPTAGYDRGFFLKSEDGNFLLKPAAVFQFRGVANSNDADDSDTESGFEIRRARFRFDGHVVTPDLTYSLVWDSNRQGGGVTLLDAWAAYKVAPEWSVKVGQFKESWSHEKDVSFTGMLAVDRTLVDTVIGGNLTDRVQGVSVTYGGTKENPFRAEVAFHDGANSKNTDFRDNIPSGATTVLNPANWGTGGRFEWKAFGDWANYRDFTAKGTKEALLVLGAGAEYTQRGDLDTILATVDAQYETSWGLNAYAGAILNNIDTGAGYRNDFGIVAQAGYLLAPEWEAFARYDVLILDDDFVTGEDLFHEITVGVNYFLGKDGSALHRAKITLDATYLPNGSPSNQTGIGVLAGDEDQFVFRAQFQLQI